MENVLLSIRYSLDMKQVNKITENYILTQKDDIVFCGFNRHPAIVAGEEDTILSFCRLHFIRRSTNHSRILDSSICSSSARFSRRYTSG